MKFEKRSEIQASARELFEWHGRPGAFARLTPPWQTVEVLREDAGLATGKRIELKLGTPLGKRVWKARHTSCVEGQEFTDTQDQGPFKSWTHRHEFAQWGESSAELIDQIDFELPFGSLGEALGSSFVERQLEKSFEYRHWITKKDLELKAALPHFRPMKIAITGGSGFLGTQLSALLNSQGHEVFVVTRSKRRESDIRWDPHKGEIELSRMEGLDAVIHLAGESLTSGRWNEERKRRLWSSRVDSTAFLADVFLRLEKPPGVFLSGSGIGFYGSETETVFAEGSRRGEGFLAELCEAWEAAALRVESLGARVCLLRTGVVIDPRGGALQQMLPAFRLGLGGPLGDGKQWFPWIGLEDWMGAVNWLLFCEEVSGPVNLVAPEALRQRQFAKILGRRLGRPAVLPAPRWAIRLALGEMGDQALLSSIRAEPKVLEDSGYRFAVPRLEEAFERVLS
ncbi:conserved hypothetical protein TIGR01777, putative [Verrucomicrobiia bacterium DG1235]|nr:conserved hypothetical protein TIGR01777, putative [Verrucomicrobiae bacterium DG1235]